MLEALIYGLVTGLGLILFIGPSFFYLVKVSLQYGMLPAIYFAMGIIISDLSLITLIYLGFSSIFESRLFQLIFSSSAGITLLILGITSIMKYRHSNSGVQISSNRHKIWYFFKGFAINALNPFTVLIWVGIIGIVGVNQSFDAGAFRFFIGGLLATILITDVLKAYLANKIKDLLSENLMKKINKVLGLIFIILGIRLLVYFIGII